MYAIIETGGKQIKVEEGSVIFTEKLNAAEGETVVFDKVVAYSNRTTRVGTPYVKGVKVTAKVEKREKARKLRSSVTTANRAVPVANRDTVSLIRN